VFQRHTIQSLFSMQGGYESITVAKPATKWPKDPMSGIRIPHIRSGAPGENSTATLLKALEINGKGMLIMTYQFTIGHGCEPNGGPTFTLSVGNHTVGQRHGPFIRYPADSCQKHGCATCYSPVKMIYAPVKKGMKGPFQVHFQNNKRNMHMRVLTIDLKGVTDMNFTKSNTDIDACGCRLGLEGWDALAMPPGCRPGKVTNFKEANLCLSGDQLDACGCKITKEGWSSTSCPHRCQLGEYTTAEEAAECKNKYRSDACGCKLGEEGWSSHAKVPGCAKGKTTNAQEAAECNGCSIGNDRDKPSLGAKDKQSLGKPALPKASMTRSQHRKHKKPDGDKDNDNVSMGRKKLENSEKKNKNAEKAMERGSDAGDEFEKQLAADEKGAKKTLDAETKGAKRQLEANATKPAMKAKLKPKPKGESKANATEPKLKKDSKESDDSEDLEFMDVERPEGPADASYSVPDPLSPPFPDAEEEEEEDRSHSKELDMLFGQVDNEALDEATAQYKLEDIDWDDAENKWADYQGFVEEQEADWDDLEKSDDDSPLQEEQLLENEEDWDIEDTSQEAIDEGQEAEDEQTMLQFEAHVAHCMKVRSGGFCEHM